MLSSTSLARQWLLLTVFLLILGGTISWNQYAEYNNTDARERGRLATQATVVDKNLENQLVATNHALDSIRRDLPAMKAGKDGMTNLKRRLESMRGAMPTTRAITVFDADGTLVARSPDQFVGQNFKDREYFQAARQGGQQERLYVAPPFLAKTGEYVLNMSKVLLDKRGEFAGVILVSLGPEYFDTLLKSVLYEPDMRSTLIHGDGKIIFRGPDPQGGTGMDLTTKPGAFFMQHLKSGQPISIFKGLAAASGEDRLTVFHTIQPAAVPMDKPLVIAVSREIAALFAPWREDVAVYGGLFVMLVLATTLGLLFYQKRQLADARLLADKEARRKQAEDALRESEGNLAITLNSIGDAVITTDPAGRVTRMNPTAERLSGWTLNEARNRPLAEVFHIINAITRETVPDPVNLVMEHGMVVGLANHTILQARGGQEYQIADSAAPIRNSSGEILGVVLVFSDVTEKYRAEGVLHLTRFSVDAASDAIFWVTSDARIVDVNEAACRSLGYTREELLRLRVPDMDAHYNADIWPQHFVELRQRGTMTFESEQRTKDGRLIPVEVVANYVKYGDEERNCAFVRDITERRRAENTLRRSVEKYRDLFDNANDAIFIVGSDLRYIDANRKAQDLLGYTREELLNMKITDFVPSDQAQRSMAEFNKLNEHGSYDNFIGKVRTKAGDWVDVEVSSSAIIEDGKIIGSRDILRDITDRKKMEAELLRTQKLESIGTLAGGIAHDFNNLLQGVFGYISLAKMTITDRGKSIASLERAEKALQQTVNLTNQLLTFSKGGKPDKKLIDLQPVIENSANFMLSGSRSNLHLHIPKELWPVEADEGQIGQVIQNIVLNADQSMPVGGTVRITAANMAKGDASLPAELAKDDHVVITIQDTGIGIPEQYLIKIFDPYFTTKEKGSGLGLATSYSIIKNHGGMIDVRTKSGAGSTFMVYLPAMAGQIRTDPSEKQQVVSLSKRAKILVMDDEKVIRNLSRDLLNLLGHEVEVAQHGREALEKYQNAMSEGKPFDLVILDLTIKGGMGGMETLHQLLTIDPQVKAIVSSGYSDDSATANYLAQGFRASLQKPYGVEALREVLNRMLIS